MLKYFVEIKNRAILLFILWFSFLIIGYAYKEIILFKIVQISIIDKFNNNLSFLYFIFTSVTEVFSVYIQLLLFFSSQILVLYLLYHFFLFLIPALFKSEYLYIILILKIVFIVWCLSLFLANYLLVPFSWNFFLSFQYFMTEQSFNLHFEAKLSEYIDFYVSLSYLCIIYCNVFTLILFLIYFNNTNKKIKKFRKIYYYSFVIFSTLVSPPEILSQFIISFITILIYEFFNFLLLFRIFIFKLIR